MMSNRLKETLTSSVSQNTNKLETGSKVAIVGGGPAGSFFALYLLQYARAKGIQPEITIYQERKFDELGPKGCKGCAGILSLSLIKNLAELKLTIPEEIIQKKINRYAVHSPYASITISNPEKETQIVSVYRGGGPRLSQFDHPTSFDGWLLRQAEKQGARVENQRVSGIHLTSKAEIELADKKLEYNLIVLACGVNAKPVPITGPQYVSPRTQLMAQDELLAGTAEVESRLGDTAHAFLIPRSEVTFGTLVPKGPYVNVSVLSMAKHPVPVNDFLNYDIVRNVLPERYQRSCGCRPRTAVSSARNYYADRFVAIGDAAVSRLYKDGIGSSLLTAREAARTVAYHGLLRRDFHRYYRPFCAKLDRDNRWGRRLFWINNKAKDSRTFLLAQHRLVGDEQSNIRGPQPFTKAAWGMFTGSYSYGDIARMALGPVSLARFTMAFVSEVLKAWTHRGVSQRKTLHVGGKKVLILGSGFGGTYVLKHLVPALNRNENVETTMVSDENFFLFAPLLHEVAMGSIETRHIAYPIRRLHWRDRFNFVQAKVEKIDLNQRKVITISGTLDFDYLVLALGSLTNTSGLPSLGPNVFTLKTLIDSMLIRNHIIGLFEQASIEKELEKQRRLLTFIVSGAGLTGVQLVTELRDFIHKTIARFYKTIDTANIRIILVAAEPVIVGELHPRLSAYIIKHLERMGIEIRLKSRITSVGEDWVEINGTENIPNCTLFWVTGVVASPQIAELDAEKDSIGRVLVNEYLEVKGFPGVYAVGDCAHFKDSRSGQPIPPRAHTTVRQARVAAYNILADIRGRDARPYRYSHNTEMVSLGASKAVFRYRGLRIYGFLARFIWFVGYSVLVTGQYNRIRIALDWWLSSIFGRDTTLLKLTKKADLST